jgi:signal transduction histidine kinase
VTGRRGGWSLRTRLIVSAGYLLVAILLALELPLARNVERTQVAGFRSTELGYAGLLASRIADAVAQETNATVEPAAAHASIADSVAAVQQQFAKNDLPPPRILVVDASYRALYDTAGEFPYGTVVSAAARPELTTAVRDGTVFAEPRHSRTLGQDLLIVAVPVFEGNRVIGAVRLSAPLNDVQEAVRSTWVGLGLIGLAALVIGLALAWVLATSVTRPVKRLEEVAGRLGAGDLDARAEEGGPAEVASLARSFNRMADAITANINAQRDFVANASHQLRTPLTGLRLRLEAIRDEGGPGAEDAAKAELEVDRMASLVQDLLMLARASEIEAEGSAVDVLDAAQAAADRWRETAERAGKHLTLQTAGDGAVWADPTDVEHVLDNLIENAIRYTDTGTSIALEAQVGPRGGRFVVTDDGPGIPSSERDRVFERFYRGATGRRTGPGTGLGLAIVRQLALRWGGDATLGNGVAERGTRVEVRFPPAPTVP